MNVNPLLSRVVGSLGGVVGGQFDGGEDVDVMIDTYRWKIIRSQELAQIR